jgi:hypothetical protein
MIFLHHGFHLSRIQELVIIQSKKAIQSKGIRGGKIEVLIILSHSVLEPVEKF